MNIEDGPFQTLQPTMVTVDLWHVEDALFALQRGLEVLKHNASECDAESLKDRVWSNYLEGIIREIEQAHNALLKSKIENQP